MSVAAVDIRRRGRKELRIVILGRATAGNSQPPAGLCSRSLFSNDIPLLALRAFSKGCSAPIQLCSTAGPSGSAPSRLRVVERRYVCIL